MHTRGRRFRGSHWAPSQSATQIESLCRDALRERLAAAVVLVTTIFLHHPSA